MNSLHPESFDFAVSAVGDAYSEHLISGASPAVWSFVRRGEVSQMIFEVLVVIRGVAPSEAGQIIEQANSHLVGTILEQ